MAEAGYGSVLEIMHSDVATQGMLRALFLDKAAYEVRKNIFEDSLDDQKAANQKRAEDEERARRRGGGHKIG